MGQGAFLYLSPGEGGGRCDFIFFISLQRLWKPLLMLLMLNLQFPVDGDKLIEVVDVVSSVFPSWFEMAWLDSTWPSLWPDVLF